MCAGGLVRVPEESPTAPRYWVCRACCSAANYSYINPNISASLNPNISASLLVAENQSTTDSRTSAASLAYNDSSPNQSSSISDGQLHAMSSVLAMNDTIAFALPSVSSISSSVILVSVCLFALLFSMSGTLSLWHPTRVLILEPSRTVCPDARRLASFRANEPCAPCLPPQLATCAPRHRLQSKRLLSF